MRGQAALRAALGLLVLGGSAIPMWSQAQGVRQTVAIRAGRLLGCHEDALDKPRRVRLAGDEPREVEQLWEAITGVPGSHGVSIRQAGAGAPAACPVGTRPAPAPYLRRRRTSTVHRALQDPDEPSGARTAGSTPRLNGRRR